MKNEEELGHYCVNPNTCGICNGIVKFEDLRDPMPALVIQVEEDEFPGVCNLAPLKGGYVIK